MTFSYEIFRVSGKVFLKKWLYRFKTYLAPSTEIMEKDKDSEVILNIFKTIEDFQSYKNAIFQERFHTEKLIADKNRNNTHWNISGFCECCQKQRKSLVDWKWFDGIIPNFKERLICEHCGLNSRQRFAASYLIKLLREMESQIFDVYLYEQITPFYSFLKKKTKHINVIGSEYLGDNKMPGKIIATIRYEDALNLSFSKQSVDVFVANDVYEHYLQI